MISSAQTQTSVTIATQTDTNDDAVWLAYKDAWTETPYLRAFSRLVPRWVKVRNSLVRKSFLAIRIPIPFCAYYAFTIAEIILIAMLVGCIIFISIFDFTIFDVPWPGVAATTPLVMAFLLASRNSVFTLLLGIPFERALFWHIGVALSAIVVGWLHGIRLLDKNCFDFIHCPMNATGQRLPFPDCSQSSYFNSSGPGRAWATRWAQQKWTNPYISGIVLSSLITLMVFTSLPCMRKRHWNLFYALHLLTVTGIVAAVVAHGSYHYGIYILAPALATYIVDLFLRYGYMAFLKNPRKADAKVLPAKVVRLSMDRRNFKYSASQYCFLMIPNLTFHIRVLGNWTSNLYKKIKKDDNQEIKVFIDGPYGSPEVDIENKKYKTFILISGGIGITPMQSICNHLVHQQRLGRQLRKIYFIWSTSDLNMLRAVFENDRQLDFTAHHIGDAERLSSSPSMTESVDLDDLVSIELYLTRLSRHHHEVNEHRLLSCVRTGRPEWLDIFKKIASDARAHRERRVAALVCGPKPMVAEVRKMCGAFTDLIAHDLKFDFHAEQFDF